MRSTRGLIIHVTTADVSLALILSQQMLAMKAAGYEVMGASSPGPHVEELESLGIPHIALRHSTRTIAPHRDLLAMRELWSVFRRLRPDIVHTHFVKPGAYGRPAARAAGVPVVVNTVHGLYATSDSPWQRRALVYAIERLASACSDAELVQTCDDLDLLARIGVPRAKLRLLGNGIDLDRFKPKAVAEDRIRVLRAEWGIGAEEVVVGVVGRLVWEKGYREIFAAAAALRARAPAVRFVVVGPEEPDKSDGINQADIARARAEGGVRFLGFRHNIEELYAAFDLLVVASHREGLCRSGMEAAAMQLPIVATDVRGCREVVDDGRSGLLVPLGRAEALADAIAALAGDPQRRAAMGAAGRRKAVTEFDQRRVIDITLETYGRLLHDAVGSRRARRLAGSGRCPTAQRSADPDGAP